MKNFIKETRLRMGISQTKLAQLSQISRTHLCRIEAGEATPTLPVALRIATALNTDTTTIFFDTSVVFKQQKEA